MTQPPINFDPQDVIQGMLDNSTKETQLKQFSNVLFELNGVNYQVESVGIYTELFSSYSEEDPCKKFYWTHKGSLKFVIQAIGQVKHPTDAESRLHGAIIDGFLFVHDVRGCLKNTFPKRIAERLSLFSIKDLKSIPEETRMLYVTEPLYGREILESLF